MPRRIHTFDGQHAASFVKDKNFALNADSPQARGLLRWYPITPSDTRAIRSSIRDFSGFQRHATASSIEGDDFVLNPFDGFALKINVSNDVFTVPAVNLSGTQPITISCWIVPDSIPNDGRVVTNSATGVILRSTNTNTVQFILNSFSSNDRATAPSNSIVVGEPALIHGIYDGTNLSIAVNGVIRDTVVPTGTYTDAGNNYRIAQAPEFACWDFRIRNVGLTADEVFAEWHPSTRWNLYKPEYRRPRVFVPAAAGPQTVVLGLASETDSALSITPVGGAITVAVGLATETDTALAITATAGAVGIAAGIATETDTSLTIAPVGGAVSVAMGLPSETDSALSMTATAGGTVEIGLVTETDTALGMTAVGGAVSVAIGLASETDTALSITPTIGQTVALGIATETDAAHGLTVLPGGVTIALGIVVETDTALVAAAVGGAATQAIGIATETDTALAMIALADVAAVPATITTAVADTATLVNACESPTELTLGTLE